MRIEFISEDMLKTRPDVMTAVKVIFEGLRESGHTVHEELPKLQGCLVGTVNGKIVSAMTFKHVGTASGQQTFIIGPSGSLPGEHNKGYYNRLWSYLIDRSNHLVDKDTVIKSATHRDNVRMLKIALNQGRRVSDYDTARGLVLFEYVVKE